MILFWVGFQRSVAGMQECTPVRQGVGGSPAGLRLPGLRRTGERSREGGVSWAPQPAPPVPPGKRHGIREEPGWAVGEPKAEAGEVLVAEAAAGLWGLRSSREQSWGGTLGPAWCLQRRGCGLRASPQGPDRCWASHWWRERGRPLHLPRRRPGQTDRPGRDPAPPYLSFPF